MLNGQWESLLHICSKMVENETSQKCKVSKERYRVMIIEWKILILKTFGFNQKAVQPTKTIN